MGIVSKGTGVKEWRVVAGSLTRKKSFRREKYSEDTRFYEEYRWVRIDVPF